MDPIPIMHHFSRLMLLVEVIFPAAIFAEEAPAQRPGLVLCFQSVDAAEDTAVPPDCRVTRLVALRIDPDQPPTPFLEAGPFEAVWTGYLEAKFLDDYTFSATGRGRFELRLNGKTVHRGKGDDLSRAGEIRVELDQGKNALQISYRSPPSGTAVFHLHWSSLDFKTEPVPPRILSHSPGTPHLQDGLARRRGRELFATHRCTACHVRTERFGANAMPELAIDAPSLSGVGSRLNADWMARWIENPRALRRHATMPRAFRADAKTGLDRRPPDIAAYLASLRTPASESRSVPTPNPRHAASGRTIFANLGCIGCHVTEEPDEASGRGDPELDGRIDLRGAKSRWKPRALVAFLKDPHRNYRWIRMPDFKLSDTEARDLASHVLSLEKTASETPTPANDGDPTRGKRLVETSGCLNCHTLEVEPALSNDYRAPGLNEIASASGSTGCLAPASRRPPARNPELQLEDVERESIRKFLEAGLLASLHRRNDLEFSSRRVEALRCIACHSRDGRLDLWSLTGGEDPGALAPPVLPPPPSGEDGEEKTAVQTRPDLTWAGSKLRSDWLARFVRGEFPYEIRPWLTSRMPIFAVDTDALARGLALQHGLEPSSTRPPGSTDSKLAEIGRRLVLVDGGFACVTCHEIGAFRIGGAAFDVKGINFKYVTRRLRKAFYHRWMLNPVRVVPGSRMPQFADDDGRTPFTDILDGDGPMQFEALWQYFLEGEKIRPPQTN